jgi:acetyl esterase/lipase
MNRVGAFLILGCASWFILLPRTGSAADPLFDRKQDVIYGRKFGTALTMDVFTPTNGAKGIGVIVVISGGFFSSHDAILPALIQPLTSRGYTVFAVVHGSQPRYTIPEIIEDMNRAVRFIRFHAADYGIDPNCIGAAGASAGGHLALMLGTAGKPGSPEAKDPVDRTSSQVQAVACFFPPTDFLNYGKPGNEKIQPMDHDRRYRAAFDYRELDQQTMLWVPITDPKRLREIARDISPVSHVSKDDPPTLIIHGDKDSLVPLQQSERIVDELSKAGVKTKLIVKKGAAHGWLGLEKDVLQLADWFDIHLKKAS